ncbi:hypothetical protein PoB_001877400 [Plakobranchus ocellatus]|uniref:Uncharacterized protein n=1 Tax=Plakobranchus ocellatus TaxID=259542 RepID=A0AAV3ZD02_9GAST|nr:hypothetical protein PoB_001877400 [Plakobranchus ocellatus]
MSSSTYTVDILRIKEILKKDKATSDRHIMANWCKESRWPYTTKLSSQEITCMRDSYFGKRALPTALEQVSNYDRIHHPDEGWDQRAKIASRQFLKPIQISARSEVSTSKNLERP